MGDHDYGRTVLVEALEELEDFVGGFRVQVTGGFIGKDYFRVVE